MSLLLRRINSLRGAGVVIGAALLAACYWGGSTTPVPIAASGGFAGTWIHLSTAWELNPSIAESPDVQGKPELVDVASSGATILKLNSNGRFYLIRCSVVASRRGIAVSSGDGQLVDLGTWRSRADLVFARHVLAYEGPDTIPPMTGEVPFTALHDDFGRLEGNSLLFGDQLYVRAPEYLSKSVDSYIAIAESSAKQKFATFSNAYWDLVPSAF